MSDLRFLAYRDLIVGLWPDSPHKTVTLAAIAARRAHLSLSPSVGCPLLAIHPALRRRQTAA